MSWQLVSFALVLVSLALAFWWYERSRPSAKLLAVVATLAALAALGRDAFAAVPDVKPITAIVLVSGVAFGAGPGFAVGAIAGLASNFLLGQGPWTPWQMLGWGLVGLIGAALGRLTSRRLSRLALALACALSAEAFNLVVDLYQWTSTGNHTLAGFVLVLGAAVVFDATHVVASFAFGFAFGPALLRMLERVRLRLQISWEPGAQPSPAPSRAATALASPPALLAVLLAVPALAFGVPAVARATASTSSATRAPRAKSATSPATQAAVAISREVSFLARAQDSDGGFGASAKEASSELYTSWSAIGLAAAGRDPLSLRRDGHTVLDAIRSEASTLQGAGDLERTILALRACGVSVRALPGGDPVTRLLRYRDSDGSFGQLANLTAFAIFALRAAGYAPAGPDVRAAARWLARQQEPDGGFGFATRGGGSDVDDTAAVLQAIVDAGTRSGPVVSRAVAFIVRSQNLDGGFPQEPGGQSNAQSTAWAIQGLVAAGRDVRTLTRKGSRSPLGYLESLVEPDGSVRYSRTGSQTPVWVTAQALTALAEKPFPIAPASVRAAATAPTAALRAARTSRTAKPARRPAPPRGADAATGLSAAQSRRLQGMAHAVGALMGAVVAPMLR